eukprot:4324754-Pleurochrysis_carterae.AAC.2
MEVAWAVVRYDDRHQKAFVLRAGALRMCWSSRESGNSPYAPGFGSEERRHRAHAHWEGDRRALSQHQARLSDGIGRIQARLPRAPDSSARDCRPSASAFAMPRESAQERVRIAPRSMRLDCIQIHPNHARVECRTMCLFEQPARITFCLSLSGLKETQYCDGRIKAAPSNNSSLKRGDANTKRNTAHGVFHVKTGKLA